MNHIFFVILVATSVQGDVINIDYLKARIPLGDWLSLEHIQTVEECVLDCGELCNEMFDTHQSCNAIIFDESNNVCSRFLYVPQPPSELKGTGLRVAWASSLYSSTYREQKAIDGDLVNGFFHSREAPPEKFPWLAIDLVWPEKVTKVVIIKRKNAEERTHDIEIRVGNDKPFQYRTSGDTLYTSNAVCGLYKGPGDNETESSVTCSTPLTGRYVTLQRIVVSSTTSINFQEVVIESSPAEDKTGGEMIEILLREDPTPGVCTSSHPYATNRGKICCSKRSSYSFWNACYGQRTPCFVPPCLNYEFKKP